MIKKILIMFILLNICIVNSVYADVSARSAVVIDGYTGKILFEKNAEQKSGMASTTKIMTAILALERGNPNDIVCVSKKAVSQEGSSLYLKAGDKIKLENLIYGLMLNSGNDAAVAIAEHISGSIEAFAVEMNKKAKEIGAFNTNFVNPNGLDSDGHYTTACDLAKIAKYAMENEEFFKIVSTKSKTVSDEGGKNIYLKNHNKLLNMYEGCIGIKTGFTKKTGRCLVSAAKKDEKFVICVTLNAPDDWKDHMQLLNYAIENIKMHKIIRKDEILKTVSVKNSNINEVKLVAADDFNYSDTDIKMMFEIPEIIDAPVYIGEKVGIVKVFNNDREVFQTDLLCKNSVVRVEKSKKEIFTSVIYKWLCSCVKNRHGILYDI